MLMIFCIWCTSVSGKDPESFCLWVYSYAPDLHPCLQRRKLLPRFHQWVADQDSREGAILLAAGELAACRIIIAQTHKVAACCFQERE